MTISYSDTPSLYEEQLRSSILQAYAYQPLLPGHIRLLDIKNIEELHLVHVSLELAPAYTAISYTWNGEPVDQSITVDTSCLKVINNLRVALPFLIKAAKTQYLWVDGLCINQEDDIEKAIQVPLMQEIYTSCSECLVWLGMCTPECEVALDAMPRIRANLQLHDASHVWDMEGIGLKSPGMMDSSLWRGLAGIFSRPWFNRIWTFQEAVLPLKATLLFGDKTLAFDDIVPLAHPLLDHFTALQHFYADDEFLKGDRLWVAFVKTMHIHNFRASGSRFQNCLNTLRMIYFTRPWNATNRLDKIYGLFGLIEPSLSKFLTVDYSKSPVQVSIEISKWYLEHGQDLYILNLASSLRYTNLTYDGLPSWAPYLAQLGSHWCIGVIWQRFRTGLDHVSKTKSTTTIKEQKLHVRGLRIDEISQVVPCISGKYQTKAEKCQQILDWEQQCLAASRSLSSEAELSGRIPEAHWTTMISAICDNRITPSRTHYDMLKSFFEAVVSGAPLSPELQARSQDLSVQIRRFHKTARSGHFFLTKGGQVGIGSKRVRPGDQICILYNGFTPFVLRPSMGSDSEYELVGDSYIFGWMHGQAFKEEAGFIEERFIII